MAHRYYVEWSAQERVNIGSMVVLADDKQGAIRRARTKLGAKVKKLRLSHFKTWRVGNRLGRQSGTVIKTFPQAATHRAEYVRGR